jgi:hypothetical protein
VDGGEFGSAIEWAASRGFSILMDPHSSSAEIGRKRRHYAERSGRRRLFRRRS